MIKKFAKGLKGFTNWLNEPRVLEISYHKVDDEPMFEEETTKEDIENVKLTVDFNQAVTNLRIKNYDKTLKLIKGFIKKQYEKDGLLPINKQVEEDAKSTLIMYARLGLIDDMNNLKPAAYEVLNV